VLTDGELRPVVDRIEVILSFPSSLAACARVTRARANLLFRLENVAHG
jgi:hypothetical protein